jgi:hypothetical protein
MSFCAFVVLSPSFFPNYHPDMALDLFALMETVYELYFEDLLYQTDDFESFPTSTEEREEEVINISVSIGKPAAS